MKIAINFLFLLFGISVFGQTNLFQPLSTALSCIDIDINARSNGMGSIGVVSDSLYQDAGLTQNPSLLATNTRDAGISLSYSPFARAIVPYINFAGLKAFYPLGTKNAIGCSFSWFDFGNLNFTDENGWPTGANHAYDLCGGVSFARRISGPISIGAGIKYIRSTEAGDGISIGPYKSHPVNTFAIDLGMNYKKNYRFSDKTTLHVQLGASISNLGPKIKYYDVPGITGSYIPTKLGLGIIVGPEFNLGNNLSLNFNLAYQPEKQLVPTPPVYDENSVLIKGKDPDISVFRALYQSFYDAPDGFKQEMHEIVNKVGGELRLSKDDKFYWSLRGGSIRSNEGRIFLRSNEGLFDGKIKYSTFGLGIGIYGFTFDYCRYSGKQKIGSKTEIFSFGFRTQLEHIFRF